MGKMEISLSRIRVVLVHPQDSRNIGAVCRAMKTMGISSLYIVGREQIQLREAGLVALHARDVLHQAVILASLEEAVRDAVLVAGITRRRGKRRKYFALSPETLASRIVSLQGITALVFGNEVSGLNDRELSHCHLAVHIPSSPLFPSLNLSHAVQIITYQIFRALSQREIDPAYHPIRASQLDLLVSVALGSLKNIGFFTQVGQEDMRIFLRDILGRAALSAPEAKRLEGIFRKISGLVAKKAVAP